MTVGTFTQPEFGSQDPQDTKIYIQNCIAVLARMAASFAPHEQTPPDMTVRVDAGPLWVGGAAVEVAAQSTGTITVPSGNTRIDRVVYDAVTGAVSVITGSEAADPDPPEIVKGKLPICQVALATDTTAIDNSLITDERIAGIGECLSELVTAENDFLVASGAGAIGKKTLAETQALVGAPMLIESRSVSASAGETFSDLTPGVKYRLEYELTYSFNSYIGLIFNGDTGANYVGILHEYYNSMNSSPAAVTGFIYALVYNNNVATICKGTLVFKSLYSNDKEVRVHGHSDAFDTGTYKANTITGRYLGAADLTSVTLFVPSGSITGRIWLYKVG